MQGRVSVSLWERQASSCFKLAQSDNQIWDTHSAVGAWSQESMKEDTGQNFMEVCGDSKLCKEFPVNL